MRLMRLGPLGQEIPAVESGGEVYDLRSVTNDINGRFFDEGGIERVRLAIEQDALLVLEGWRSLRVGAPVARPAALVCIGMNYAAHARESGAEPPSTPVVFFKHPNTIVGAFDNVLIPPGARKVDWEVELAVVIGTRARYLDDPSDSRSHLAGFAISNDVSERAYQLEESGGQWSKGKCCETFNPLGPYLVPTSEVDYSSVRLKSFVNGDARQDSSTADLIFSVDYLVWHLSQYMTLEPGDIVNTGTPQGVALSGRFPYLRDGDTMTMSIDGLGEQTQRLTDTVTGK